MHSNLQRHKQKATTLAKDVETLKAALDAITGIVEEPGKSTIPLSTSTPQHQLQPEYSGPFSVSLPNSKTAPIISPTWLISPVSETNNKIFIGILYIRCLQSLYVNYTITIVYCLVAYHFYGGRRCCQTEGMDCATGKEPV